MSENEEKQTKNDWEEKKFIEEEETLETILSDCGEGWTVSIYRTLPSWSKGFMEKLEILPDQPIDMTYLLENWGGQTLRLVIKDPKGKIRRKKDVDIADYPKKFGVRLYSPNEEESERRRLSPPTQDNTLLIELIKQMGSQNSQPQQQDSSVLVALINQMGSNNTQNSDTTLLTEVMRQKESTNDHLFEFMKNQMNNNSNKDFKNVVNQMKDMQEFLGNGDNNSNDMAAMGNIVEKFMGVQMDKEKYKIQQQIKSKNHQTEAHLPELPERTGQLQPEQPQQSQQPQQQPQQQTLKQFLDKIPDLELAVYAKERLDKMDEPIRHQVLEEMMGEGFEYADDEDEVTEGETIDENTCDNDNEPINFTDAEKPGQQIERNDVSRTNNTGPTEIYT